ncbi:hypothetical protein MASR2M64_14250 [Candidatus Cloacimonadota bacterium]
MIHDLTNMYNDKFEDLVIGICTDILLGVGVQRFSSGKDRGIDAKYVGKSNLFTNEGQHIIQAKHSNSPISSFSDNDFFRNQNSVINCEIPKIKKLFDDKELDFYILFSNRKLTDGSSIDVTNHISKETGIPKQSIKLIGVEDIHEYLRINPNLPNKYNINDFYSPLGVVPDELTNVVEAFSKVFNLINQASDDQSPKAIRLDNKNLINKLSSEYFNYITQNSLSYFESIETYLRDPLNLPHKMTYLDSAGHLQSRVLAELSKGKNMDEILNALYENLLNGNSFLMSNKRLTRIFLHFMYCSCDIGKKDA